MSIFSIPLFFNFSELSKYLWNITFIFGRCHRSLDTITSVKYGCHLRNLTCTFVSSKKLGDICENTCCILAFMSDR